MATLQTLPEATTFLPPASGAPVGTLAVRSFLYAIFKHRRLVIGIFLLVFLASAIAALLRPRGWRATSKVLVKLGETVQLAPAEAPSKSIDLPLTPEVVNTEAEIVKSRQVLESAVAKLGVKPEPGKSIDEMLAGMALALTVAPTPASNILQISFVGRDPVKAARMVNTITDTYIDHHNRVYRNEGVHSFYTEQLRTLEDAMKTAQHRLHDFLRQEKIVDVDQEIHILNQDLVEQDKMLKGHRAKIAGVEQKLQECVKGLGGRESANLHELVLGLVERPLLQAVLRETGGNQLRAAALLGINRNTLRKKLRALGLRAELADPSM